MHYRLLAVVFAACLTAGLAHAQAPQPSADADGLMHVELTLQAQNVSVAYPPDLSSEAAEHRALLSGTVGSRVRVGTLEAHRALRIGSLAPDLSPPPEPDADDDDDSPAPPPPMTMPTPMRMSDRRRRATSSGSSGIPRGGSSKHMRK